MVLIEALVALCVLLTVGVGLALLLNTLISKVLETRARRTLAGRIALKEKEFEEHDRYMRQLELWLLAQRGGEANLNSVASSYS